MGEITLVPNCQIRYKLTRAEEELLKRDWLSFKNEIPEKFSNDYLNDIIRGYLQYCKNVKSVIFEDEMKQFLKDPKKKESSEVRIYSIPDRISLNTSTIKSLNEHVYISDRLNKFSNYKRQLVEKLLDDYCNLSYAEREMVYFYENYLKILESIREKCILRIETLSLNNGAIERYNIWPYTLETDRITGFNYLVGYATTVSSLDKIPFSIRLQRILTCENTKHDGVLLPIERELLKKAIAKHGIPYINNNDEQVDIKVKLTKLGKVFFMKRIQHQRPMPISTANDGDECIMTFQCSERQIYNYFFKFGAEVEIISPQSLRDKFRNEYQKALNIYIGSDKSQI